VLRAAYRVIEKDRLRITLDFRATRPGILTVSPQEGAGPAAQTVKSKKGSVSFDAENGSIYVVTWP